GKNPERTSRAFLDLQGRSQDHRTRSGKHVEIRKALQTVTAPAMHVEMRRKGWVEMLALARIRADGLHAETEDIAFIEQPADDFGARSRRMRSVFLDIGVGHDV